MGKSLEEKLKEINEEVVEQVMYIPPEEDIFERILKRHEKMKQDAYDRSMKGVE